MNQALNDLEKTKPPSPPINIEIYGATQAGKTRFLFQLLEYWRQTDRLLPKSNEALAFMAQVRAEIDRHGGSMPTAAATEGITVSVRRGPKEQAWNLVFRDLRGELLADEIPPDGEIQKKGVVARQVRECNAFLFFFDPTCSENPSNIEKHHDRELERATKFIEYVLDVRQNNHLPIIFVQTHSDILISDVDVSTKAKHWSSQVHAKLVELYDDRLKKYYPRPLIDRDRTFFCVSSVQKELEANEPLEQVVRELIALVAECGVFQGRTRKTVRKALWTGLFLLLLLSPLLLSFFMGPGAPPGSPPPPHPDPISDREIRSELDELERLLKAYANGASIPSVDDAGKINRHLRWLARWLEPDSGGLSGLPDQTQKKIRDAYSVAANLVRATADRQDPLADRMPVLTAFLLELRDLRSTSPELGEVQSRNWQLQRSFMQDQFASLIKRRDKVKSPAKDVLAELVKTMQSFEQELEQCKVWSAESRRSLASEIQAARNFCEDRLRSSSYPIRFRVASALLLSPPNADLDWRNLRILSPNRTDDLSTDGIALVPNDQQIAIDIRATIVWGDKCWEGYQNEVTLQINGEELWKGGVKSAKGTSYAVPAQRRLCKRGDLLNFFGEIKVTDGTFIFSSREHGKGSLRVNVGKLLDKEDVLELDKYGYGNCIRIAASRADAGQPNEFHTKKSQYDAELGLGSPVTCILSVHRGNEWRQLNEVDLVTDRGPLTPLGMPLLYRGESQVSRILQGGGMEIKLEFFESQYVPLILWEAAKLAMESDP